MAHVDVRQHNLPVEVSSFVGREREQVELAALLRSSRLLTLVGPGGAGKTRLALQVASTALGDFQEGVWLIEFGPLGDSALVPQSVAQVLGVREQDGMALTDTVGASLGRSRVLLVLDNCEHLIAACGQLSESLLRTCERVHILATSREPLGLSGEVLWRVPPLGLPADDTHAPEADAVRLFVERAAASVPNFALTNQNRAAVADVCRRLDGLPLAIELAAARVPLLGVEGLRDKLDQRFHVLTAGRRATLARHQTLRGALDWSYQLLTKDEQTVLRRLGVFVGGFTLEAAQQVADDEQGIDVWDVLEHLGALVDKSLVVAEGDTLPRYRLLESTRLFALERLIDSGELNVIRGRHRDHFLQVAEACERHLPAGDPSLGLHRLDRERDNLLLALAWSPLEEDALLGLRLAAAMQHYWYIRALPSLGAELTRTALTRPGAQAPTIVRCRALATAGWMSMWTGQFDEAVSYMEQALNLA